MRLTVPWIDEDEASEVNEVLESGFLTQGPKAAQFAAAVAEYVGVRHAITTSSCTTALHLALVALGVGDGDEVVVPDFTFPATANAVIQQGATPVPVDIDLATYNMDPDALRARLTDRTKAVIPVHAFGLCADMDALTAALGVREIPLLEDAACAIGGSYHGRLAGSLGDVACFSFHPRKIITPGEGGMITTSSDHLADRMTLLATHGGRKDELYLSFEESGFNYRMSDINAAVGLAQMRKLEHIIARRRELAAHYVAQLSDLSQLSLPSEPIGVRHTFQSFVVRLADPIDRDDVIRRMRQRGIETTLGTYSLHVQPYFRAAGLAPSSGLSQSRRAFRSSLTLPLYPQMTTSDVDRVADELHTIITSLS